MQPSDKKSDRELLAWAGDIVAQRQKEGIYGTVSIIMEAGRIIRVQTLTTELPPVTNPPKG